MLSFQILLKTLESKIEFFLTQLHSYLTNNMPGVERFPLSFQSQFSGNHFHHIVLGVHSGGRFGALGISRREDLMFKPLELRTLMDLVQEFEGAYRGYWHTLRKVRIGQYVSHDPHSVEQIEWKHSILDVDKLTKEELRKELERHTRDMRLKVQHSGSVFIGTLQPKHKADVFFMFSFCFTFHLYSVTLIALLTPAQADGALAGQ